jgi:hypothetical protein
MKKKTNKLVLAKETLRNLGVILGQVVGGNYTDSCQSCSCDCHHTVDCTRVDYSVEFSCQCTTTDNVVQPQTRNC